MPSPRPKCSSQRATTKSMFFGSYPLDTWQWRLRHAMQLPGPNVSRRHGLAHVRRAWWSLLGCGARKVAFRLGRFVRPMRLRPGCAQRHAAFVTMLVLRAVVQSIFLKCRETMKAGSSFLLQHRTRFCFFRLSGHPFLFFGQTDMNVTQRRQGTDKTKRD